MSTISTDLGRLNDISNASGIPVPATEILERVMRKHDIVVRGIVSAGGAAKDTEFLNRCVDRRSPNSFQHIVSCIKIEIDIWKIGFYCPQLARRILRNKKSLLGSPEFCDIEISDDATISHF